MSYTTVRAEVRVAGVLVDPSSVTLQDALGVYGVRRTDTLATVVAAGTAMTRVSTGVYTHKFLDPGEGLVYEYVVKAAYAGVSTYQSGVARGGSVPEQNLSSALDKRIVPYAAGVQLPIVHQLEREAFVAFCRQTEIWRVKVTTVTVAGQASYALAVPSGTSLWKVLSFSVGGVPVNVEPLGPASTAMTLKIAPSSSGAAVVSWVVVLPDESRSTAPVWLLTTRFGQGLAGYVLARLKEMEGTKWYAPREAGRHQAVFDDAVCDGRMEAAKWRGDEKTMPTPWFC